MSRTRRIDNTRDGRSFDTTLRRGYYSTEAKWARKSTNRKNRQVAASLLGRGFDPDATVIPDPPSTGGRISH